MRKKQQIYGGMPLQSNTSSGVQEFAVLLLIDVVVSNARSDVISKILPSEVFSRDSVSKDA